MQVQPNYKWAVDNSDLDAKYTDPIPTPKEVEERIMRVVKRIAFAGTFCFRKTQNFKDKALRPMFTREEEIVIFYKYKVNRP